ncbi:glycosyltransferase family 2 protein [Ferrimonas aestuarii]|uniref:Glycosyltransferase family 2 protein n=1 Tax=Ferrimonas aestuarii TaxID=2569539 RepID=A0A4U1BQL0_9GAMM|nr:glycosyltransferase family 2 protein [Ferrimonas aestuarii]TKB56287.1 glycosyltransferase family 2 protein [Ferrimonas aestuarii]
MNHHHRPRLACALITKNAGPRFAEVLASVDWVDEIVILDSGSSDDTIEVAERAGAKVFQSEDWPGFGPQRQRAQQHVSADWVLWLDTDEVVTPELRQSIEAVISSEPDPSIAYEVNRLSDFFGRFIRRSGWYPDSVVRLHATNRYHYNDALVHERIEVPKGKLKSLSGDLLHYTSDDYRGYMAKSLQYADAWAEARHAKGKRTSVAGIIGRSFWCFLRKYLLQLGFLEGRHGLLLALQSSHYVFNKYFGLWVRQNKLK